MYGDLIADQLDRLRSVDRDDAQGRNRGKYPEACQVAPATQHSIPRRRLGGYVECMVGVRHHQRYVTPGGLQDGTGLY
jgi:hypothetical protein